MALPPISRLLGQPLSFKTEAQLLASNIESGRLCFALDTENYFLSATGPFIPLVGSGGPTTPGTTEEDSIVRWDSTTGAAIADSLWKISDTGALDYDTATPGTGAAGTINALAYELDGSPFVPGSSTFLGLTDVLEADYVGHQLHVVQVNTGETGLQFLDLNANYVAYVDHNVDVFPVWTNAANGTITNSAQLVQDIVDGRLDSSAYKKFKFPATTLGLQTGLDLGDVWRDTQGDGRSLRFFDSKDHPRFVLEYSAPTVPTTAAGNVDLYVSGLTTREGEDAASFPARQYVRSQQEPNQNYHTVHFGFTAENATLPTGNIDDRLKPQHSMGLWNWNGADVTDEGNYNPFLLTHKDDSSVAIGVLSSTSTDSSEDPFTLNIPSTPAFSQGSTTGPFDVTVSVDDTLNLKVDGGATQTVTLTPGATQTAAQVAADINAQTTGIRAVEEPSTQVKIYSETPGTQGSLEVEAGNANTLLGLTVALNQNGTDVQAVRESLAVPGTSFGANIFLHGKVAIESTVDPVGVIFPHHLFVPETPPPSATILWADNRGDINFTHAGNEITLVGRQPEALSIGENSIPRWIDTTGNAVGNAVDGSDWVMGGATGTTINYVGATGGPVIDGGINAKGFFKDGVEIGAGGAGIPTVGSSTDNALVRWDGVSGDAVQDTPWIRVFDVGTLSINSPVTGTNAMSIVAENLTNGKGLSVTSGSEDATTRQLVYIHNESDVATGTVPLYVANESPTETVFIQNNINGPALRAETFATTGFGYELNSDALTTGTGLYLRSNSANTSSRAVAHFLNDNALATGAQVLRLQQDANQVSLRLEGTGGGSVSMNEVATVPGGAPGAGNGVYWVRNDTPSVPVFTDDAGTDHVLNAAGGGGIPTIGSSTDHALVRWDGVSGDAVQNTSFATLSDLGELSLTSSATTSAALQITADSLANNGSGITVDSNSADATYRYLVNINQGNASATQTGNLSIFQAGPQSAVSLYSAGNGKVLTADGAATTSDIAEIKSNTITTGTVLHISSNSANTSARSVSQFINDNTAATGANCIRTQQDAAQVSMLMEGTGGGSIKMLEVATVPGGSPGAGYGTWWVRNDSKPIFTDDGGVDHDLSASGSGIPTIGSSTDNSLVRWNGATGDAVQNTSFATLSDLGEMTLASTATTGTVLDIDANSLTTGNGIDIRSTSGSTGSRELLYVRNGSLAATGTKCLLVSQEAAQYAVQIESLGNGTALRTDCFSSTAHAHDLNANSITTGSGLRVRSNSFNTSSRAVCHFINDHTSATGAQVLRLQQDAAQVSLRLEGTGGGSISMNEVAAVPGGAPGAGNGTWWVRNDTPSVPVFTDDAGTDHVLNAGGGATTFLGLTDTPSSYATQALKAVRVNAGATALEFFDAATGDVTGGAESVDESIPTFDGTTGKAIQGGNGWRINSGGLLYGLATKDNARLKTIEPGSANRTAPAGVIAQFINRPSGATGGDPCHLQLVAGTVGASRLMFGDNNQDFAGGLEYNHLGDRLTFRQKNVDVGYVSFNGGLVWGTPTSPNDNAGSISAQAVFDDGVLLTDYVFEAYFEGKPRDEQHKDYRMNTLTEEVEHIKENLHLSTMPSREEWEADGNKSVGELVTGLWETVETQMLYIKELEGRITRLENKE